MTVQRIRGRPLQRRNRRFLAEHPLCARCEAQGLVAEAVEVDHRIPLYKGGQDEEANLQGLCRSCHVEKTRDDMGHKQPRRFGPDGFPIE